MSSAIDRLEGAGVALDRERELRRRIFTPPPKLTVSQWADANRMLTSIASAEPGRWRTDRAPYQRGILDAFSDPMIEEVAVMSSAQVGKTEVVLNVAGFFIDQDAAPMLVLQPSIDMARAFSKDRLREMIRATPALGRKIQESERRKAEDTILHKQFAGGHITMVGANAPSGLASRPVRVVLCDEIDRYPTSAGKEGDPVALAKKRTATFWNRKIGEFSTPTVKGTSRIEASFLEGDQRRYFVPCPHCGHKQFLRWPQLDHETAQYACEDCGALIAETDKPAMLAKGEWIPTNPGRHKASFHLNALYSPWTTWAELVREYDSAKAIPERLKTFVNTSLGESYEEPGERIDAGSLSARRELYPAEVPAAVGVLTAAIDVQGDRLELAIKGWGAKQESWLIAHHRVYGNPDTADVWDRADTLLTKPYAHESGALLYVRSACVDTGYKTNVVYEFVALRQQRGTWATKGHSVRGKPLVSRPAKANKYRVKVVPIGTDTAKDVIFDRLRTERPKDFRDGDVVPGYMHFPMPGGDGGDDEYLAQFGREKKALRYDKGVPFHVYVLEPEGARNEAIDLEVLNLAALHMLGAGVYDRLATWVAKTQADGARRRESQPVANAEPTPAIQQFPASPVMPGPRIPRPGGYVNSWKR